MSEYSAVRGYRRVESRKSQGCRRAGATDPSNTVVRQRPSKAPCLGTLPARRVFL